MAGAERFESLLTWQRMYELSLEVWKVTNLPPSSKDFDYRNEIRDASDSAHRNVAEGFGRYNPAEFARFLDMSRASALETQALLRKGRDINYLTPEQFAHLDQLAERGLQALARFQRYLRSPQARRNAQQRRHRRSDELREGDSRTPSTTWSAQNASHPRNEPKAAERSERPNESNVPNDPNDPNE
jgi:four helix bundle protein